GKGLREFFALTRHCTAVIGNEGGANNMAKALDIPTFTIFSPMLKKKNWFGADETPPHMAVHLADYKPMNAVSHKTVKKNSQFYYEKLKFELIKPQLEAFLSDQFS